MLFRFVIFGVLFNQIKLISTETLCLQCLAKINQYRYSITEFFLRGKVTCLLLQQAVVKQRGVNKL